MIKITKYIILVSILLLMTGCLYPQDRLAQNQVPYESQIDAVQRAVDSYKKANNGLLPIKTRDLTTPIYQKYPIDFNKMMPRYIQDPPGSAFESGGVFLYVLVDVETEPRVKLFDLTVSEKIRELKLRLEVYRREHGYPPVKEVIGTNLFTIDYRKLGLKEDPYVSSPFTGNNLPFIMNNEIELFVDYRMDLFHFLNKFEEHTFKVGDDIRPILVNNSMFVPAHSLAYTVNENNEPIFLTE